MQPLPQPPTDPKGLWLVLEKSGLEGIQLTGFKESMEDNHQWNKWYKVTWTVSIDEDVSLPWHKHTQFFLLSTMSGMNHYTITLFNNDYNVHYDNNHHFSQNLHNHTPPNPTHLQGPQAAGQAATIASTSHELLIWHGNIAHTSLYAQYQQARYELQALQYVVFVGVIICIYCTRWHFVLRNLNMQLFDWLTLPQHSAIVPSTSDTTSVTCGLRVSCR